MIYHSASPKHKLVLNFSAESTGVYLQHLHVWSIQVNCFIRRHNTVVCVVRTNFIRTSNLQFSGYESDMLTTWPLNRRQLNPGQLRACHL